MLFLIDVDIDYGKLGDNLNELLEEEWKRSKYLYESGLMLRIWRKANAKGAVAVWNVPDHEALKENITKMPLYPYFSDIKLIPLITHPKFPQFAESDSPRF
jgi:muconolactone delta-isomerase